MRRRRSYGYNLPWDSWNYRPASPRQVRGGIKAQSRGGRFASSWWGKRWIHVLESFGMRPRLARGRSYARSGQVVDLEIAAGRIRSRVQGTQTAPYNVTIELKTLSRISWQEVASAVARRPILAAKLLAGEMPMELEDVFEEMGVPLFPRSRRDLKTNCSCPDWSNPCKHIAAVYYLLAEAVDRDPFLLLRVRGRDRKGFSALIGGGLPACAIVSAKKEGESPETPLPSEPSRFWQAEAQKSECHRMSLKPGAFAALPRRLGPVPFWRSPLDFLALMDELYETASGLGDTILAGGVESTQEDKLGPTGEKAA